MQQGSSPILELTQDTFPDTIPALSLLLAQANCAGRPWRGSLNEEVV